MEFLVKTFQELTAVELYEILAVRARVFVVEQDCAYQDIDGLDMEALHVFARDKSGVCAYLRVFSGDGCTARIGRVLTTVRGQGLGVAVLKKGIIAAETQLKKDRIYLEAQTHAVGFYKREGFRTATLLCF